MGEARISRSIFSLGIIAANNSRQQLRLIGRYKTVSVSLTLYFFSPCGDANRLAASPKYSGERISSYFANAQEESRE